MWHLRKSIFLLIIWCRISFWNSDILYLLAQNKHLQMNTSGLLNLLLRQLSAGIWKLQYTLWVWGHSLRESEPAVHTLWGHSLRELWGNFLREPEPAEHTLWGHSWRELFEAILWGNPNLQYTLFSYLRKSEPAVGRERVTQYWLFSTPTGHYTFWSKMLMELQMCSSLNINAVPTKSCWMPRTLPIFTDLKEL